jgi:hypothetical protein
LAVVSTRMKPFSPRLEPLSMKLSNSVPSMDCLLGYVASPAQSSSEEDIHTYNREGVTACRVGQEQFRIASRTPVIVGITPESAKHSLFVEGSTFRRAIFLSQIRGRNRSPRVCIST